MRKLQNLQMNDINKQIMVDRQFILFLVLDKIDFLLMDGGNNQNLIFEIRSIRFIRGDFFVRKK